MSNLRDRIAHTGQTQTNSVYTPSSGRAYAKGTDHTSLGLGEPGAVNASGMNYPPTAGDRAYGAARVTPLVLIRVYDDGSLSYDDSAISDPAGLVVPQTGPGQWAQLYRAGRLYGR